MFKHISLAGVLLVFLCTSLAAAELKYPVSAIPDSLKANAKVVIRNRIQEFEIKDLGKGVESVSYAITILNENGLRNAIFIVPYSQKLQRIHSINGTIYDASGKKVESLTMDKVIDHSAIAGYSLYEDRRVKGFVPKTKAYPFTVEYSYVMEYDGLLELPEWQPIDAYNVAVEQSSFKLICPNNLPVRFLEKNLPQKAIVDKSDASTSYLWQVKNLVAYTEQPFSGSMRDYAPLLMIAPDEFEIEGYKGTRSNWTDYGKLFNDLNKGRDELSPETKSKLVEMVRNCTTDYEKAKTIYEYMQQKTRYLNITIGIGGWQPIPAETVDRLGYGDCKALSNYLKALLDAVGIKSYYTIVLAGEAIEATYKGFPNNNFNHIIICLPQSHDTLWLECTSQHIPFGYIGTFTDDRDALVITENGGKLVHTRIYSADENQLIRNAILKIGPSGDAILLSNSRYNGVFYDNKIAVYMASTEDKKKSILDDINLPGAILGKFEYQEKKAEVPAILERIELEVPRYGTISSTRILASIIPLYRQKSVPKKVSVRKSDVVIYRSEITVDTITIMIPDGYQIESVPAEIKAESRFGVYTLQPFARENKIVCIRTLKMNKGQFPPSTYNELIDFYKKIASADNSKFSIKQKGT